MWSPLVKELLEQLHQTNSPDLEQDLILSHEIKQGNEDKDSSLLHQDSFCFKKDTNGYDCGVAVISLIKRIGEKYEGDLGKVELGEFDFKKERRELRKRYLKEKN
jgi:hypothetical protein